MKKVFITDIDGTLIHYDERDKENIAAFKRIKEKGHIAIACTGRSLEGVESVEKEHGIKFDYYIVLNGAMILDEEKNIICNKRIKSEDAYDIVKMIEADCLNISINTGEKYYFVSGPGELALDKPLGFKLDSLELEEVKNQNISALVMNYCKGDGKHIEYLDSVCERVNNKYMDSVIAYRNTRFIDIVPCGCSKGEGVKSIEDTLNVKNKDIYTIGDSGNDISMLRGEYNSFTFSYAEEIIKKEAKFIINSFSECVDKYLLENK